MHQHVISLIVDISKTSLVTPYLSGCLGLSELYFVQKKRWPFKTCRSAGQSPVDSESVNGFSPVTAFIQSSSNNSETLLRVTAQPPCNLSHMSTALTQQPTLSQILTYPLAGVCRSCSLSNVTALRHYIQPYIGLIGFWSSYIPIGTSRNFCSRFRRAHAIIRLRRYERETRCSSCDYSTVRPGGNLLYERYHDTEQEVRIKTALTTGNRGDLLFSL